MGETVQGSNGAQIPLDSLDQVFTYSGNFISTITVFYQGSYFNQTFTNNGTNITEISGWIDAIPPFQTGLVSETGNILVGEGSTATNPIFLVAE